MKTRNFIITIATNVQYAEKRGEKIFYITEICEDIDIHNKLTYDKICDFIKKNKLNYIDFNIKSNLCKLTEHTHSNNSNLENLNTRKEHDKHTKIKLSLNSKELSRIKTKVLGKLKGINVLECINKIEDESFKLEVLESDVKYLIKSKNNELENRIQKMYIFGNKERRELMNNKDFSRIYFIEITFKIVPKCYRPYKILTIATLDNKDNKIIIVGF